MEDLINLLLPPISVILSAFISYFISKANAKNEIKKLSMKFDREDRDKFYNNFAKLLRCTTDFLDFPTTNTINEAIEVNTLLLTAAPKKYLPLLQKMDIALNSRNANCIAQAREQLIQLFSAEK